MTGFNPTYFIITTSTANPSLRASSVMAFPPYLMTTVLPAKVRMYGSASTKMLAFLMSLFINDSGCGGCVRRTSSEDESAQILVLHDVSQPLLHVGRIHQHLPLAEVRSL